MTNGHAHVGVHAHVRRHTRALESSEFSLKQACLGRGVGDREFRVFRAVLNVSNFGMQEIPDRSSIGKRWLSRCVGLNVQNVLSS